MFLNGDELGMRDARGEPITDDSFLLLFNASEAEIDFTIPTGPYGDEWSAVIDTNDPMLEAGERVAKAGEEVPVESRSLVVFQRVA